MGEIKQANFRIDADSAKAFRDFCDSQGVSQADGFKNTGIRSSKKSIT